jgi:hypothetical protein
MAFIPPLIAGFAYAATHNRLGTHQTSPKEIAYFLTLYAVSLIVSCLYIYFFYLRYMYVM